MSTVFLNGEYLPVAEAKISVDDRGFLFSDGIYEVTPSYRGHLFGWQRHMQRLLKGLCELRIDQDVSGLEAMHHRLLEENDLLDEETALVYLQITRGAAPRTHAFPKDPVPPTVYAFAKRWRRPSDERWERGFEAVTVPDRRWGRADIKTVSLLPNVLAQQASVDAGVDDALLIRDGMAVEGAHQNFFAVFGGTLVTHPASNVILHGITRGYVLEIAREIGIPVEERAIMTESMKYADEAFFTGTTTEVRPTTRIDGEPVGSGEVGPVTRRLAEAFRAKIDAFAADSEIAAD
ncbi:MAG TPA: D-amino acid aminotransferase [Longimicrobiales bacterium]|nr:D-amino acid aminotransferase [Longimicrobiales bacterium]